MNPLLAACAGLCAGIVTGLTPGVHVNLVCTLLLASYIYLPFGVGNDVVVFIVAMAITHTFLDSIPSIFLGAPNEKTALGVLPGHRYLLAGNGLMAVKLSTIGALSGLILGAATFSVFEKITKLTELIPRTVFGYIIGCVPVIMWLRDSKKFAAATIILLSSAFGFIGFSFHNPLFPMLSGMFGAATMIYSLWEATVIPEQKTLPYTQLRTLDALRAALGGLIAGGLTAVLPGLGAAHAAVVGMLLAAGTGDHGFLILTGTIGTTNFFLSLAAYNAVEKARNGALLAATAIVPDFSAQAAIGAALFAGGAGTILAILIGRRAAALMTKLPYKKLTIGVLVFVTALVALLEGWKGTLLYATGTALGLIPACTKAARAHAMSCILVPVAWRFIAG